MTTLSDRYATELLQTVPHRILLTQVPDPRPYRNGLAIAVSCPCGPVVVTSRGGGRKRHEPIEIRTLFPAAEAIADWRAWHAERGVTV